MSKSYRVRKFAELAGITVRSLPAGAASAEAHGQQIKSLPDRDTRE